MDDAFVARMRRVFSDAELVELGLVTGAFIVLGRLHRAFGIAAMGSASHAALAGTAPAEALARPEPGGHSVTSRPAAHQNFPGGTP